MKKLLWPAGLALLLVALFPLLWLCAQAPLLLRQEKDAATLLALAPRAYLLGEAFISPMYPGQQKARLLSHDGRYVRHLAAQGWQKADQFGAVSLWKNQNNSQRLSLSCRKFSLWFEVCDVEQQSKS